MIGENSIIKNFIVPNVNDKKHPYEVIVQANKNYGICEIYIPHNFLAPEKPIQPTKESNAAYKAAKLIYDANMGRIRRMRNRILDEFQGRQLNSESIRIHLHNVLYETLNRE